MMSKTIQAHGIKRHSTNSAEVKCSTATLYYSTTASLNHNGAHFWTIQTIRMHQTHSIKHYTSFAYG